jgi:hypothetical protein
MRKTKLEQRSNCVFSGNYVAENVEFRKFRKPQNSGRYVYVGDYKTKCYFCKKTFGVGDYYVKYGAMKVCRICLEKNIVIAIENMKLLKAFLHKKLRWLKKNKEKLNNEETINAL